MSNNTLSITLPDGSQVDHPNGISGMEIAKSISEGLARNALAITVNGEVWDLSRPITEDSLVSILTWRDDEGKKVFWHSSAHLMAEALEALYPGVKFGIGPAIAQGFYYDVDLGDRKLGQEDLDLIEKKMRELANKANNFNRRTVGKTEASEYFTTKDDEYKLELIEDLVDGEITFYSQGDFTDLCRGPHVPNTGFLKHTKLLTIAGAYWRGDQERQQLTRIYGVTFPKKGLLDEHLDRLEQAKLRDHRKLGRELELFTFSKLVGVGLPLWLPKGAIMRDLLIDYMKKEQLKRGYQPVVTPHIGRLELYKTSGHYPYYKESQFPPMIDGEEGEDEGFLLKPMNCPHHTQIYADKMHSYRDLPVRLAEFGTVYRYEQSGEVSGLTRVRGFTQDDAHIFCTPEQVKEEFKNVIDLILTVLRALDFKDFKAQISLRDSADAEKYIGADELWDDAERAIKEAAAEMNLDAVEVEGEAAFYGPKLDFMINDALGREWQLGTVQVDYNLPERFDLTYIGEDNNKHRPVMIHRAPFGSLERFIGVLIEHCAGKFPLWLSPVQATVLPVAYDFNDYAKEVAAKMTAQGLRVEVDDRNEKIGYKIRQAELSKIPYMLIVGEKEIDADSVGVRKQSEGDKGMRTVDDFIADIKGEVASAFSH